MKLKREQEKGQVSFVGQGGKFGFYHQRKPLNYFKHGYKIICI